MTAEECFRNGEWTKWVIERCTEEQKILFYDFRARINNEGLSYLSDNNLLRYMKSYNYNMELAFTKLVNGEKWRRENGCMEVYRHEIQNEINMRFAMVHGNDT